MAKGGPDGNTTRKCYTCGKEGHIAKNCKNSSQGERPSEGGSQSQDRTPSGSNTSGTDDLTTKTEQTMRDRRCYNCHQRGHLARQCPNALYCTDVVGEGKEVGQGVVGEGREVVKGVVGEGREVVKGVVGEGRGVVKGVVGEGKKVVQGVVGEGREVVKGVVGEGKEVVQGVVGKGKGVGPGVAEEGVAPIGRQEGSSVNRASVYRSGTVPEEQHLPGQAVTLRCVHGDTVLYPLAEVEVEVNGVVMQVFAAVSDTLPVSVLLGTESQSLACYSSKTQVGSIPLMLRRCWWSLLHRQRDRNRRSSVGYIRRG